MSNKIDDLTEQNFAATVLKYAGKVSSKHSTPGDLIKVDSEDTKLVSSLELYLIECGTRIAHLISLYEQLIHIPAYLKKYKRTSSMASKKITRMDYTKYHLENFIIKSKSFEDRALQLSSAVGHTGINIKDVNFTLITRNTHIRETDVKKILSNIHNLCDEYSDERNGIIHRRNLLDEDLREVEFMLLSSRYMEESKRFAQAEYRRLIQKFVKEKVPEIEEFNEKLFKKTVNLFDALEPIFNLWVNRLKEKDSTAT